MQDSATPLLRARWNSTCLLVSDVLLISVHAAIHPTRRSGVFLPGILCGTTGLASTLARTDQEARVERRNGHRRSEAFAGRQRSGGSGGGGAVVGAGGGGGARRHEE